MEDFNINKTAEAAKLLLDLSYSAVLGCQKAELHPALVNLVMEQHNCANGLHKMVTDLISFSEQMVELNKQLLHDLSVKNMLINNRIREN